MVALVARTLLQWHSRSRSAGTSLRPQALPSKQSRSRSQAQALFRLEKERLRAKREWRLGQVRLQFEREQELVRKHSQLKKAGVWARKRNKLKQSELCLNAHNKSLSKMPLSSRLGRCFPKQWKESEYVFGELAASQSWELGKGVSWWRVKIRYYRNLAHAWTSFLCAIALGSVRSKLSRY